MYTLLKRRYTANDYNYMFDFYIMNGESWDFLKRVDDDVSAGKIGCSTAVRKIVEKLNREDCPAIIDERHGIATQLSFLDD